METKRKPKAKLFSRMNAAHIMARTYICITNFNPPKPPQPAMGLLLIDTSAPNGAIGQNKNNQEDRNGCTNL